MYAATVDTASRSCRRDAASSATDAHPHAAPRSARRRRLIDPTTCDRDYGGDEVEFMQAVERYKRTSGRMFPTCSEILEVVKSLGYTRPNGG